MDVLHPLQTKVISALCCMMKAMLKMLIALNIALLIMTNKYVQQLTCCVCREHVNDVEEVETNSYDWV